MSEPTICRGCFEEVEAENNPMLHCKKCGTVNKTADSPTPVPKHNKPRRDLSGAEGVIVVLVSIIGLLSLLVWFSDGFGKAIAVFGVGAFATLVYFLPSVVGKDKKNSQAILVLNAFLGWTLIGWVVSLVWATTKD